MFTQLCPFRNLHAPSSEMRLWGAPRRLGLRCDQEEPAGKASKPWPSPSYVPDKRGPSRLPAQTATGLGQGRGGGGGWSGLGRGAWSLEASASERESGARDGAGPKVTEGTLTLPAAPELGLCMIQVERGRGAAEGARAPPLRGGGGGTWV